MPDANGRIKGISTVGVSNRWLDAVTYVNELQREMKRLEREEASCPGSAPEPSRPGRATTETVLVLKRG